MTKCFRIIFLLALLVATCFPALAKEDGFVQRVFSARDGLGSTNITSITEDSRGFIWLTTEEGLFRVSNNVVRRVDLADGEPLLDGAYLSDVREVHPDLLLVSSERKAYFYDVIHNQFQLLGSEQLFPDYDGGSIVRASHLPNGDLLLLTDKHAVWRMSADASTLTKFIDLPKLDHEYWNRMLLLKDKLILGTRTQLDVFSLHGDMLESLKWTDNHGRIYQLFQDSEQRIWIGTRNGLYQLNPYTNAISAVDEMKYGCLKITEDSKGNLWIVTNTGLIKYSPATKKVQSFKAALSQQAGIETVGSLFVDSHDLLWVTGASQPLAIAAETPKFVQATFNTRGDYKLPFDIIWTISGRGDKRWFGGNGTMAQVDINTHGSQAFSLSSLNPSDSVYQVDSFDDNTIIAATTNGLVFVDKKTLKEVDAASFVGENNTLRGTIIWYMHRFQDDYWLASTDGLIRWSLRDNSFSHVQLPFDPKASSQYVYGVSVDRQHRIWVGGDSLFGYFENEKFISKGQLFTQKLNKVATVNQVMEVGDNQYWLATRDDGLWLYDLTNETLSSLTNKWQVDCASVYFIEQTDKFNVVGCANKLLRQDKASGEVISLSKDDGLIAKEFNEGSFWQAPDSTLYVGTPDGAMALDINALAKRIPNEKIILESMSVYYEDTTEMSLLPLPNSDVRPGAKLVSFQLSSLNYLGLNNLSFKYRLHRIGDADEGNFISLENQSQINIAGLSSGRYELEVKGKTNGMWEQKALVYPFVVHLYWWEMPWVKFLFLAILLVALVSIIVYRNYQVRRIKLINSALTVSEDRLRQSLRGSESDLWEWHRISNQLYLQNHGGILSDDVDDIIVTPSDLPLHPDDRPAVLEQWSKMLSGEQDNFDCEYRYKTKDGTWGWLRVRGSPVDKDPTTGDVIKAAGIYSDVTEARALEQEVNLLARAFENTSEGVLILDADERIEVSNQAAERVVGLTEDEIEGMPIEEVISHRDGSSASIRDLLGARDYWAGEREIVTASRKLCPIWLNVSTIKNERKQIQYFVLVFSDITERKQSEAELRKLANYDVLTGLPNRSLFANRLEQAIARAEDQQQKLALMFLDLDRFKHVNDYYGHSMGDALLVEAANRLQSVLNKEEVLCRFGGDEFVVLVNSGDIDTINRVSEAMLAQISNPFKLFGREFFISTSIGISIWPDDTRQPETLIKNADQAMYHAKDEGRGNFQYYSRERNTEALYHLRLEGDLRKAIELNEFELYYQGQFDLLQDDRMTGVEALLRWKHPKDGFVRPDIFIKVAESCGLIVDIDRWVLRRACVDGAKWCHAAGEDFRMSVNISAVHFRQPDFIDAVSQILQETGMPASQLTLEITEGVLMKELHIARQHLQRLRNMSIEVAIDDFGTGYSSLAYLRHFEVNTLKVDRSFLIDIATNSADQAIVSSIIELARNLKLKVVAEGVETREQLEQVFSRGCYVIQGYYFCKPMPALELIDWLAKRDHSKA